VKPTTHPNLFAAHLLLKEKAYKASPSGEAPPKAVMRWYAGLPVADYREEFFGGS
jgi:hypothetical protein